MSARAWSGRKVRHLVTLTLTTKGTTCHLCGLPGADSADHDPPRSTLVRSGVPDPDHPVYLHPAHRRPCNFARHTRPVTEALRAELRAKRLAFLAGDDVTTAAAPVGLSPRFARRRVDLLSAADSQEGIPSPLSPRPPGKTVEPSRNGAEQ